MSPENPHSTSQLLCVCDIFDTVWNLYQIVLSLSTHLILQDVLVVEIQKDL